MGFAAVSITNPAGTVRLICNKPQSFRLLRTLVILMIPPEGDQVGFSVLSSYPA
jgi:hypothetical protein